MLLILLSRTLLKYYYYSLPVMQSHRHYLKPHIYIVLLLVRNNSNLRFKTYTGVLVYDVAYLLHQFENVCGGCPADVDYKSRVFLGYLGTADSESLESGLIYECRRETADRSFECAARARVVKRLFGDAFLVQLLHFGDYFLVVALLQFEYGRKHDVSRGLVDYCFYRSARVHRRCIHKSGCHPAS